MRNAVTVSQLNKYIKDMFTQNRLLYDVMVKGEISNLKESRGNYYFSLKDDTAAIQAIVFLNYGNIDIDMSKVNDGMQVTVKGRVASYEKTGTYAIYVNSIENTGLGEYFIRLEELKKKLSDMGMFDESYKKPIPKYSMNIGVVTAKNGAAIKDIERTIKNKNPYAKIYLYPSLVQGESAYKSIVDGIMTLDKLNLDNIIIGRGGGSIEDLYCFNDERVAYAIFNAHTPIISAVGHEINDSISDLVADVRVATPTAAGEMATFSYKEFLSDTENYKKELKDIVDEKISITKEKIDIAKRELELLSPTSKLKRYKDEVLHHKEILKRTIYNRLGDCKNRVSIYVEMLKNQDPLIKLSKGLTYVMDKSGNRVTTIKKVKIGDIVNIRLKDGKMVSEVKKISK